jgi:hypothetical protein
MRLARLLNTYRGRALAGCTPSTASISSSSEKLTLLEMAQGRPRLSEQATTNREKADSDSIFFANHPVTSHMKAVILSLWAFVAQALPPVSGREMTTKEVIAVCCGLLSVIVVGFWIRRRNNKQK